MKNKEVHPVITLVKEWEIFEQENPEGSIEAFCQNYLDKSKLKKETSLKKKASTLPLRAADGLTATLGRVNKYMHFYFRKMMQQLPLDNVEDWIYLITLNTKGAMRKSDLINQNISEFTSGTNVINRLLKHQLIEEFPDPDDARSKHVKTTKEGAAMVYECLPHMIKASDLLWEQVLTEEEQKTAYQILLKADIYHSQHFSEIRNLDVDSISDKLKRK